MKAKKQYKIKQQILNAIPIFLAKTYKIVDNPEYQDIISWCQDGQQFVVKDINRLTTQILPKHFKHSNFASFVRQLNMYGFHKVKSEERGHAFAHQAFQKGEVQVSGIISRQKLKDIRRKKGHTADIQQASETNMMVPLRKNGQSEFQKQLNVVRNKHQALQGFVSLLVDQNKQILLQNRNFVSKMSKMEEKYRNKLQTWMLLLLFGKAKNCKGQPFILPPQFEKMLQSLNQTGSGRDCSVNQDAGLKKKPKLDEVRLKMIKNQSQAQINNKQSRAIQNAQKEDSESLMSPIDGYRKQMIYDTKDQLEDSLGVIQSSPNHSPISFDQLYGEEQKSDHLSQFLDKLHHSDQGYGDFSFVNDRQD